MTMTRINSKTTARQTSVMSKTFGHKTVLITGSKEGIGFHTALQLASRNWTVLMADKEDLIRAKQTIVANTGNRNVLTYQLDLSSFESIRNFISCLKLTVNRLDVLVNNAGIYKAVQEKTVDGLNSVMQVNHLGPFLLTVLLADFLKTSPPGKIIFLSSSGAFFHTLSRKQLPDLTTAHNDTLTYYNSKLCNMIISKEMACRLEKFGITSNCLHPGMTGSNFLLGGSNLRYLKPVVQKCIKLMTQDPERSAGMVTFLACSRTVSTISGQYFVNYQIRRTPKLVDDNDYCMKLWNQAEQIVKLKEEEKLSK